MALLASRGPAIDDVFFAIARGSVPNWRAINKNGRNPDVDTGTQPEDVWGGSGLWVPPTDARVHDIVSTDATDAAAGTGARSVLVQGLDANWERISETVSLNGTTPVPTANAYRRINRMSVEEAGTGQTNAGDITATAQVDATLTNMVPALHAQDQSCIYTVPANQVAYVLDIAGSMSRTQTGNANSELTVMVRDHLEANPVTRIGVSGGLSLNGTAIAILTTRIPNRVTGPADIWAQVARVSANNTIVTAVLGILVGPS